MDTDEYPDHYEDNYTHAQNSYHSDSYSNATVYDNVYNAEDSITNELLTPPRRVITQPQDGPIHSYDRGGVCVSTNVPPPMARFRPSEGEAPYSRGFQDGYPHHTDMSVLTRFPVAPPSELNTEHTPPSYSSYTTQLTTNGWPHPTDGGIVACSPPPSHNSCLRSVSELPDVYRGIFTFGVFNAVQSNCFDCVMRSNENMVISAPTGSGKTVLFELGIIRLLDDARDTGKFAKCVYVAPTKALCSERLRDWATKFEPLGIKCCEMTGDTVRFDKSIWGDAKDASIIITTGEKWDSLTRNWQEHERILTQVQLFLVDEVHVLNESRGSTLEVVISRMKSRGIGVRFMLVSATVPNIQDVAAWIGAAEASGGRATMFQFGEEFRPCFLRRIVIGVPRQKNSHDFVFSRLLDFKLFPALQAHSLGKPILVFCPTRKGAFAAAEQLKRDFEEAEKTKERLPWTRPSKISAVFHDKRLTDLALAGIGVHHAGLVFEDRRTIEDLYSQKILRVVAATSTLAVGVNLPAHLVVIKGVYTFQNNASAEYSDLEVMQMVGRAGRPQFDNDGIAIILCETELEHKYRAMAQGTTILESNLHVNLAEHLNSEIGLRTIGDVTSAKLWLRESFLFQRLQKNPQHYILNKDDKQSWEERIDELVLQSLAQLKHAGLIEGPGIEDGKGALSSTEYGDIMSKFYIKQSTMELIMSLPEKPSTREMLETLSNAEELCASPLRSSEKQVLNKLRRHNDIRFSVSKVEKTSDKIFLLLQAVLGGIPLSTAELKGGDSQLHMEAFLIFRHVSRLARAIVEVAIVKRNGTQIKHGLEIVRCLNAKAWEDRPVLLRQIEQIGGKALQILAEHGITSLETLRKQDPMRIESLLNRRPPFGLEILASAMEFPQYCVSIQEIEVTKKDGCTEVNLEVGCGLLAYETNVSRKKPKGYGPPMTTILTLTSDMDFIDFRRIPTKALQTSKTFGITVPFAKTNQSISVYLSAEAMAGTMVTHSYKPSILCSHYTIPNTRPLTSIDLDLTGLEEDPDFWNMSISGTDDNNDSTGESSHIPETRKSRMPDSGKEQVANPKPFQHSDGTKTTRPKETWIECSHSCQDKSVCGHRCCREGVNKTRRKQKTSPVKSGSAAIQRGKLAAIDQRVQTLEALHNATNVAGSLKMEKGRRIKIPSAPTQPNFDVNFVELTHAQPSALDVFNTCNPDDEGDLPIALEILPNPTTTTVEVNSNLNRGYHTQGSIISVPPRIRTREPADEPMTPAKRVKYDTHNYHHRQPATLPQDGGPNDGGPLDLQVQHELVTPQASEPLLQGSDGQENEDGFDLALFLPSPEPVWSSLANLVQLSSSEPTETPGYPSSQRQDEFTEFDEWLLAGSVEIE